jgi:type VI secretion system protein VasJ
VLNERAGMLAARAPVAPATAESMPAAEVVEAPVTTASTAFAQPSGTPAAAPLAQPCAALAPLPSVVADTADLDKFLGATGEALEQAARTLREVAPADPRAYRLLRTGLWLHLVGTPPLRPDGNTGLPGLELRDHAALAELAAASRWAGLLARSENLLPTRRLALDLQRYSAVALAGLGPEYAAAGDAIRVELRALLARLPGLAALRDRDGQPLADADTQRWLAAEVLPRATASAGPSAGSDTDAAFWTDLRPRLRGETRSEALADAQRHIDAGHGQQQRLRRRLALASLCDDVDPPLATHLFTALADDLERRDLDAWDPSLGVEVLAGLARAQHRARDVPAMRRAFHRLARLDASAAARLLTELPEPRP